MSFMPYMKLKTTVIDMIDITIESDDVQQLILLLTPLRGIIFLQEIMLFTDYP